MANLKEIRNRISSVGSTMQITSAMKMVSAAKLKRAQDAILQMRPYANKLTELLVNLSSSLDSAEGGEFSSERKINNVLLVPITSNRGLCGGFNANIIKETLRLGREDFKAKKVDVLGIGKKGGDILSKTQTMKSRHDSLFDDPNFEDTALVAVEVMEEFREGIYDKVLLVYNRFKNAATQLITVEQFLPIVSEGISSEITRGDYLYEPSQSAIVKELLPKSLKIQLFKALLDSLASEHGARMTAMHKATDNATELSLIHI